MKFYIKQKVFSWTDKFSIKDEYGEDRYFVEGEFLSWGKKLHMNDTSGNEVAFIQQKVWSFLPRYYVFMGEQQVAEIVKEFTFLRPKYSIEGLGWDVNGSFSAHDYEITCNGEVVASIHKEWMTWGDCYEVDIHNSNDEAIVLSVVLTIDCVMAASAAAASSSVN